MGILRQGESLNFEVKNKTVQRLVIKVVARHTTNNIAIVAADVNLDAVLAKIHLNRGGQLHTLVADKIKPLVIESAYRRASFQHVKPLNPTYTQLIVQGAAIKNLVMQTLYIDLGTPINLRGDDKLQVQLDSMNNLFSNNIDVTGSFIEADMEEAVGYETFTPIIQTKTVQAGESRIQLDLGDNVQEVMWVNTDKTTQTEGDKVIEQFSIATDRWSKTDNYRELIASRAEDFRFLTESDERAQTFSLLKGEDFDNVRLDVTLNPANVAAGKNIIVVRSFMTSADQVELAQLSRQRHEIRQMTKVGLANQAIARVREDVEKRRAMILKRLRG
jgi:hypothetical protein